MRRVHLYAALAFCLCAAAGASSALAASNSSWPLWDNYKTHFMSADGRIVDWASEDRTTSEGEAYALFFALVANDRAAFDLILNWSQNNLAKGSLQEQLPSWLFKRIGNGQWGVADSNSASDADLWMAYTLIQAGKLWQEHSYSSLGHSLAQGIADREVTVLNGEKTFLLPGRTGFHSSDGTFFANPSYAPLQLLTSLSVELPGGPWHSLLEGAPDLLAPAIGHGFAMDWVRYGTASGFLAIDSPSNSHAGSGSYDAIRVYLWAGMLDSMAPGREQVLNSLAGMKSYLETHDFPPERVAPDGAVLEDRAPIGFSAAVTPFLLAIGNEPKANAQQARIESQRVNSTGLYGPDQNYYDQNLILFARGWIEGMFRFDSQGQLQVRWKTL